jgi:hypothetical protein
MLTRRILLKGTTVATNSVSIAISEATRCLDELGESALYTRDELENLIRASFASMRASEVARNKLHEGILTIINRAASRVVEGKFGNAL